mgnify:CR=1 FL=1
MCVQRRCHTGVLEATHPRWNAIIQADNSAQAQEWIEAMTSKRFQDVEHRNHILEEILSTSTSQVEELKEKLKSHNVQCDGAFAVI